MFIKAISAPYIGEVTLSPQRRRRKNQVTLLTGSNGSGKTEVLRTIANVFHGRFHWKDLQPSKVYWTADGLAQVTTASTRETTGRPRVVAQTFSPFSRFPGRNELLNDPRLTSMFSSREHGANEYVGIGFDSDTPVNMRDFSRLIVENGLLRLSEQPKAAKAVLNVLLDMGFREGMLLRYRANQRLDALMSIAHLPHEMERALDEFLVSGDINVLAPKSGRWVSTTLHFELRQHGVHYVAAYLREALNLIRPHLDASLSAGAKSSAYAFRTFEEFGMVGDYPVLQSFTILRRLGLLTLFNCQLTPNDDEMVDVTSTSSGQQQMLCSFFGLAAALEDEAVVLIDEPELSLHPRWQLNYLRHVENILDLFSGCHVIIATHSPLITQSGVTHGAHIVHLGEPHDALPQPDEGDAVSVEEALVNIFETPLPKSLHVSNQIFELVSKAESGTYSDRRNSQDQLEAYLQLYQRAGDGSREMIHLLEKAIRLISSSGTFFRYPR